MPSQFHMHPDTKGDFINRAFCARVCEELLALGVMVAITMGERTFAAVLQANFFFFCAEAPFSMVKALQLAVERRRKKRQRSTLQLKMINGPDL